MEVYGVSNPREMARALKLAGWKGDVMVDESKVVARILETGKLVVKVGKVEIDLNDKCIGKFLIDGLNLPVHKATITILPGQPAQVTVTFWAGKGK